MADHPTIGPEFRDGGDWSICSAIRERRFMTRFLVLVLRDHFADANRFNNPYLRQGDYVWRGPYDAADQSTAGLVIEDLAVWRPRQALATPAIVVRGNDWQRQKPLIGDGAGERRMAIWVGSHTIFCIAADEGVCDYLAFEVAFYLAGFAQEIRSNLGLLRFGVSDVAATGPLQEPADCHATPVNVGYGLTDDWFIRPYAPRIAEIAVTQQT